MGWGEVGERRQTDVPTTTGVTWATFPTSSSACMMRFMRAVGNFVFTSTPPVSIFCMLIAGIEFMLWLLLLPPFSTFGFLPRRLGVAVTGAGCSGW